MSVPVKEIAFILHPVADIERARAFYGKLLGLKPGVEMEFAPGMWWIEYDVGGVALAVSNHRAVPPGAGTSVALEVADIQAALAAIKEAGLPITQELVEFPVCRMFGITSPDGHPMMFHQRKAPPAG
jgi:predicted enzyme related to lactoylglutathione lyase